ncbi:MULTISPECIES: NfeD family protein [unclassified Bartonella]|uniref:NfeD family protein n=1 Tax=unclassified Bartonella TaxID=2645622 RepID=UPI0015FCA07D|nr:MULTISPECIES: NfeD family protein [unclassified Bartonella]UXN07413.1 NfeD family protein [Bartonella sp. HY761]
MLDFFEILGYWCWLIAGFILLVLELFVAGVYLMWFGLAAIATAIVVWLLEGHFPIFAMWQTQLFIFIIFSVITVLIGVKLNQKSKMTDAPFLNNRTEELIGYVSTLEEPIINGKGRLRIGDSLWNIIGPDLPQGTTVRIKSYQNGFFEVESIN